MACEKSLKAVLAVAVLAIIISGYAIASPYLQPTKAETIKPSKKTIYMSAIEPKGGTTVDKEPYPAKPLPEGKGYVIKPPKDGRWEVSNYRWEPATVVVFKGDEVTLKILGVNGDVHDVIIEGLGQAFTVKRGEVITVTFTADKVGTFRMICNNHLPTMVGHIVVLPNTIG